MFKDFLLFSGRVESRDNICITENYLIDKRNKTKRKHNNYPSKKEELRETSNPHPRTIE